jgi:dTDP-4-amino-4,6-dideoxygalactose transaminase
MRVAIWERYHELLQGLEARGLLRRQIVPPGCRHNGHMYFVLLAPQIARDTVLQRLRDQQIIATFHYVPLHSSPAGRRLGRAAGELTVTDDAAARLVRLPLWPGLRQQDQQRVVDALSEALGPAITRA